MLSKTRDKEGTKIDSILDRNDKHSVEGEDVTQRRWKSFDKSGSWITQEIKRITLKKRNFENSLKSFIHNILIITMEENAL